jgi:hypothetical protein
MYPRRDWAGSRCYFGRPADREYARWLEVKKCISSVQERPAQDTKTQLQLAKRLCRTAYELPTDYDAGRQWRTPAETERDGGVCLDKSIWLMDAMHRKGLSKVRLVVGVHHGEWRASGHAWLVWDSGSKKYLLDPSEGGGFVCPLGFFTSQYEPEKSFQGSRMWYHAQQPDTVLQALKWSKTGG